MVRLRTSNQSDPGDLPLITIINHHQPSLTIINQFRITENTWLCENGGVIFWGFRPTWDLRGEKGKKMA